MGTGLVPIRHAGGLSRFQPAGCRGERWAYVGMTRYARHRKIPDDSPAQTRLRTTSVMLPDRRHRVTTPRQGGPFTVIHSLTWKGGEMGSHPPAELSCASSVAHKRGQVAPHNLADVLGCRLVVARERLLHQCDVAGER